MILGLAACGREDRPPAKRAGPVPPVASPPPTVEETVVRAVPGLALEAEMKGGDARAYLIPLQAGQFAGLAVEQQGLDVAVTVAGPDGRRLAESDSVFGAWGPEPVPMITETAGRYRLEIRAPDPAAPPGRCILRLAALHPVTVRDRSRIEAERLFAGSEALRQRDDQASLEAGLAKAGQALEIFRDLDDRSRQAGVLYSLGLASLRLGRDTDAVGFIREALGLFRALGREREAGRALYRLGEAHRHLGEPLKALEVYREALALNRRLGERWTEATTLNNRAKVYGDLGEIDKAVADYQQALALYRDLGDRGQEANALANLGHLYQSLGETQKALDRLQPALAIFEAQDSPRDVARTLVALGDAWSRAGQGGKGIAALQRALGIYRRIGDRWGEAVALNDLGWIYILQGDWRTVRDYFAQAHTLFRQVQDRPSEAVALANLGWADERLGRPAAAAEAFGQALPLLAAFGDRDAEAGAFLGLARIRRRQGDLEASRKAVETGVERIESLRGSAASHEIRAAFLAQKQDFYTFQVDLFMELHRREPRAGWDAQALAASEQARARSLLDRLSESGADLRRGADPALLAREAEAARKVDQADLQRRQLAAAGAPAARIAEAERRLRQLLDEQDRLETELRLASPRYAALTRPRPLSAREIRGKLLDAGTVLLEFHLGDERSFLWVVTPGSLAAFELPPRKVLESKARRAYELAASRRVLARGEAALALAEVSRLLLGPAEPLLGDKRLLVVGDGALHYLPFAALPDPARPSTPLIARHEIVTAPSASSLAVLRRELAGRKPAPKILAVVADPVFDAADPRVTRGKSPAAALTSPRGGAASGGSFKRLPFSGDEARSLLALAPADSRLGALGFAARREIVLDGTLASYRIVHFATHGVLDADHPALSSIVLSRVDEQGRPRDGFVRAHELYRLSLPADLVVLSACRTALGREMRGEGLIGLTRGFQYAGARAVLVSLWEVEDHATAELMRLFYREMLERGRPPAAALRAAQEALRQRPGWESPYFWAGFVLQGDWRAADKPVRSVRDLKGGYAKP